VVVKGHTYKLDEFLFGSYENKQHFLKLLNVVKERNNELKYILLYLSPKDYHRYHSAAICSQNYRRHIPGSLYSVNPSFVNKVKADTFNANERVVLFGEWIHGFFSTTFIGATNVGSIVLNFDKDLTTNSKYFNSAQHYDKNYLLMTELDGIFKNNLIIKKQSQGENEEDIIDIRNDLKYIDIRDIIDVDSQTGKHHSLALQNSSILL
jgi:phosphatidylserine decarboxylase precursor